MQYFSDNWIDIKATAKMQLAFYLFQEKSKRATWRCSHEGQSNVQGQLHTARFWPGFLEILTCQCLIPRVNHRQLCTSLNLAEPTHYHINCIYLCIYRLFLGQYFKIVALMENPHYVAEVAVAHMEMMIIYCLLGSLYQTNATVQRDTVVMLIQTLSFIYI